MRAPRSCACHEAEGASTRPCWRGYVNPLPEYLAAAGITRGAQETSIVWHSFRHTCAAALVSGMWGRSWTLEEVKGLLGHESISTTERYAHLADSALRKAAAETRKPAISPRPPAKLPAKSSDSSMISLRSHLRDLNSRPTVYETVALPLS